MRRAVVLAALVPVLAAVGCGNDRSDSAAGQRDGGGSSESGGDTSPLPLTGETTEGVRYRLEAGTPSEGDDVPSSWCLGLRYSADIVIGDEPLVERHDGCGEAPAPRVSGTVQIACPQRAVFVFGGAHESVQGVELVSEPGGTVRARLAELPPGSGFAGKSFLLVAGVGDLPAEVHEQGADDAVLARIPDEEELCEPVPGAPEGPLPFMTFPR